MKALIIGYGSIGKRHEEVLLALERITSVHLVTKQKIKDRKILAHTLDETFELDFISN